MRRGRRRRALRAVDKPEGPRCPVAKVRVPASRLRKVARAPGQRHTAPVAALDLTSPACVYRLRVLQAVPRNIRHLKEPKLLALVDVDRAGKCKLHEDSGAGTALAHRTVLDIARAVAQDPVRRDLMVRPRGNLRQTVARGVAHHVVVRHDPRGGRAGALGRGKPLLNGTMKIGCAPIGLGKLKVKDLAELLRGGVEILVIGVHPRLTHGKARRLVLVKDLAPLAIDLVDLRTIPKRV